MSIAIPNSYRDTKGNSDPNSNTNANSYAHPKPDAYTNADFSMHCS
jgi:hypothetical protein